MIIIKKLSKISIWPKMGFFSSDWAQIFRIGVSRPGDSENALRSAGFFSIFFSGFFLYTPPPDHPPQAANIINPDINPNINPNINPKRDIALQDVPRSQASPDRFPRSAPGPGVLVRFNEF